MRLPVLLACLATVASTGCFDSTRPAPGVGHYELVAVNGQPMPFVVPPSGGFTYTPLYIGDLVLRADGTYGLAAGWFSEGTWTLDGTRLYLSQPRGQESNPPVAVVDGDSVVIDVAGSASQTGIGSLPSMHYLFRLSNAAQPAVTSGTFVLTTVNGRGEPLFLQDTTMNGVHYTDRVLFDTVTFRDGVFFRQHRAEQYFTGTNAGSTEYTTNGSYRARPDSLLLSYDGYAPTPDRLAVEQSQLVRRTRFISGTAEERYTKR